jgi:hypothetical protein
MIGLKVKEKQVAKVKRELRIFKVPFQVMHGSTIFVLPVIRKKTLIRGKVVKVEKFGIDDIYNLLLHLKQIGIKAQLLFPI